jgi:hypothetical protein
MAVTTRSYATKGHRACDMTSKRTERIRAAVANYIRSEGCSCCQDIDAHTKAAEVLAKLLEVDPYDDGSGYDFYKYVTKP